MKKILMAEPLEYNSALHVGNHQYAKLFSKNGYEVLWLNPMYSNLTYLINKGGYIERERHHKSGLSKISDNLYQYSPKTRCLYGNKLIFNKRIFNKLSIKCTYPNIKNILEKYRFNDIDVLWLSSPKYYYLKNIVKYKKLVHRCSDDISGFNTVCKSMLYFEEKIIKEADRVFVTANNLMKKKKKLRSDLIYLPNGVEINNFIRDKYILPKEFYRNRPKCIFVGAIHDWVDVELIKYSAEKLRQIDFYLIGPVKTNVDLIKNNENIFLLGKRKYEKIPNYLYYSDVAIIPFKINNLTNSITPVKLYEYMSVGLNVVSTNFKEMNYINSPAYLANDKEKFYKKIIKGIENKHNNKYKNIQFAKKNTWKERFNNIINYL